MKFTNISRIFALLAGVALLACNPSENNPDDIDKEKLNENLEFTLEVMTDEIDENSAKIKVSHNGEKSDTWYGFATTETNINNAIQSELENITEEDGTIKGLKKVTSTNVTLRNLESNTTYTYVVFGLSEKGTVYGTPAQVEFTTKKAFTGLTESQDWTITYEGRQDGEEIFNVDCSETSIYMFDIIDEYYITDEEGNVLINEYMLMLVDEYSTLFDEGITVDQLLNAGYLQSGPGALQTSRMASGDYYAFAIGYNADGTPVGTYSKKRFTIEQEEATAEYLQWAGTYSVQDANGAYFDIEIIPVDNNYMYGVIGWETGEYFNRDTDNDGKLDGVDFTTAFDGYTLAFAAYYNTGNIDFYEYVVTQLQMTDTEVADFGLYGWGRYEGKLTALYTGGSLLGRGTTNDNGQTGTITGSTVQSNTGVEIAIEAMSYVAMNENNYWWFNDPITFPISMTKKAEEVSQQSIRPISKNFGKKFNNEKTSINAAGKFEKRVF